MSGAGTIGRISRVPKEVKQGVFNQALIRMKLNYEVADPDFFIQWMRSDNLQRKLTQANPASAMANLVPMSELKEWKVIVPKKEEQVKLGIFISKIENIITLEQEKLKLYEQLKTFIINNILSRKGLSPILFFDSVNKEWKVHKIKEIAALNNNARIPVKESERVPGLIPYYGANGIQDFVEGNTHEGEFALIAEDGANDITDYPSKFVTGKIWVNNHAHVITGYKEVLDTNFFSYLFKTLNIARYLVGSGRWKLNAGTLLEIPIYIPEYNQQLKISSLLNTFDTLIQNGEYKIKNYNRLKNLLLQNLFV